MLNKKTIYNNLIGTPVFVSEIGAHIHPRGKSENLRTNFVIHYVIEGEGIFCGESVKKGQGFLIQPYTSFYYENNGGKDWTYCWIIVDGNGAADFIKSATFPSENGIFDVPYIEKVEILFENALNSEFHYDKPLFMRGMLDILAAYQKSTVLDLNDTFGDDFHKNIFERATVFIRQNINKKITVSSLSEYLNVSYSLLYLIFMNNIGVSPQKYIITQRIAKAKDLLVKTNYPIKAIAFSTGYNDQLAFSKIFIKNEYVSPSKYRTANKK